MKGYLKICCLFLLSRGAASQLDEVSTSLVESLNAGNTDEAVSTRFGFFSLGSCINPLGNEGQCVSVNQCPLLVNVWNQHRTQQVLNFMLQSVCNIHNGLFWLCCPSTVPLNRPQHVASPLFSGGALPQPVPHGNYENPLVPNESECGFSTTTRIVGGVGTLRGEFPWLVAVGFPQAGGTFRAVCGGTLITKRHVLTAAHCFTQQTIKFLTHVQVGDYSLSQTDDGGSPWSVPIVDRTNPGYDAKAQRNDIELLTLGQDVPFSNFVRPLCLPIGLERTNFEGVPVIVSGWGDTRFGSQQGSDIPQKTSVTGIQLTTCQTAYKNVKNSPVLDNTQICAQGEGRDACQGDSGGPLIYNNHNNRRYYLAGIVSYGVECANPKYPGVYTRVAAFLPWIMNTLR